MNAIRIGGGSEGGRVCNMQFNTIVYACGEETKFGSWPNSAKADQDKAYWQNQTELRFITVGDCRNQICTMTSIMVVSRASSFKPTRVKPHRVAPLDWVLMVPGIPWFTRRSIRLALI